MTRYLAGKLSGDKIMRVLIGILIVLDQRVIDKPLKDFNERKDMITFAHQSSVRIV